MSTRLWAWGPGGYHYFLRHTTCDLLPTYLPNLPTYLSTYLPTYLPTYLFTYFPIYSTLQHFRGGLWRVLSGLHVHIPRLRGRDLGPRLDRGPQERRWCLREERGKMRMYNIQYNNLDNNNESINNNNDNDDDNNSSKCLNKLQPS